MRSRGARLVFVMALVAATLFLSTSAGAATPRPMRDLSTKKPQLHAGSSSVLFWRVHIEDHSGDLRGLEPRFLVGPPRDLETMRTLFPAPMASLPAQPEMPCGAFGTLTASEEVTQ